MKFPLFTRAEDYVRRTAAHVEAEVEDFLASARGELMAIKSQLLADAKNMEDRIASLKADHSDILAEVSMTESVFKKVTGNV